VLGVLGAIVLARAALAAALGGAIWLVLRTGSFAFRSLRLKPRPPASDDAPGPSDTRE